MAAGIAHEINTPTQFIGDNIHFLQEAFHELQPLFAAYDRFLESTLPESPAQSEARKIREACDLNYLKNEIPKAIDQSLEGISRVTKIVKAMKDFSHPGLDTKTPLDLNHAIENTILVCRNEWKYVANIVTRFQPNLPLVPVYPGEFNQVILNLIINAAHAIEASLPSRSSKKGTITISTRHDQDFVLISIQDTGTGIPKKVRHRIFDPFFTTKGIGKGTGQGLAISRSVIVDKHRGKLSFETASGQGTTFLIQLPVPN